MEQPIKTTKLDNGKTVKIYYDSNTHNPRHVWDDLGTFLMAHNRYDFGDKDVGYTIGDAGSWEEEEKAIAKEFDTAVILPVYMYDHSGQTINTTGFSCSWDSGQIGFIWISKEKARKECGWKLLTKARLAKLEEYLRGEIKTLDQYLTGDVYGYVIEDSDGEVEDSCWGFYGMEYCEEEALSLAKHVNAA